MSRSALQAEAAAYLAQLGIRAPLRSGAGVLRGIVDADDNLVAVLMPTGSRTTDLDRAEAFIAAINAACGFEPALRIAAE
ncbi:hypothetical protein [Methylobacterium oxalidis]|uniref:Uncharacterized protein n=1 Tax=Methylobacterium oxalidis TaxID=944322 RepID=A0A512J916_9HYPH|nr:hypothetical protein [Methylobacterium oxalidis]GEP06460.1 hypothetical protein MOX02_44980 [Methylobacterium oxalidis]GJE33516.1 hypothetical protein LDDCCGHA_3716 [Methylobacterium oxalidis]GLS65500.1 hypothetical protein GCM10007888_38820 [Methylobacterium oxalidis]